MRKCFSAGKTKTLWNMWFRREEKKGRFYEESFVDCRDAVISVIGNGGRRHNHSLG
jgi:hypothetical protein